MRLRLLFKAKHAAEASLLEIANRLDALTGRFAKHSATLSNDEANTLQRLRKEYKALKKTASRPSKKWSDRADELESDIQALEPRFNKQIFDAIEAESEGMTSGVLTTLERNSKVYDITVQPQWVSRGGFGQVHLGSNQDLGIVVLKLTLQNGQTTPGDKERRHLREAHIWQTLKHENILEFYGTCKVKDVLHIVSPFAENGTFLEYFKRNPEADRGKLLTDVASAMAYMHGEDVIHGDLRCVNILVSSTMRAWLCDFGMSKEVEAITSIALKNVGSYFWLSPERLGAEDGVSTWTKKGDVHSFGITIMEALDGKVPFDLTIRPTGFYVGRMDGTLQPDCAGREGYLIDIAKDCWQFFPEDRPDFIDVTGRLMRGMGHA